MGRLQLQIFFWASRLLILFFFPIHVSDIETYGNHAFRLVNGGEWPYRDFPYEYPPLTYLLVFLPGWIHQALGFTTVAAYRIIFGLFILPFDYLVFHRLWRAPPIPEASFFYVFLSALLPFLLFDRIDVVVGCFIALPFLGGAPAKDSRFALAWALGGAVKVVPFLLLPLRVFDWPKWEWGRVIRFALLPLVVTGICFGLVAGFSHGKISFLSHHSERGVQVESLAANLLFVAKIGGLYSGGVVQSNFGAQHIDGLVWLGQAAKALFWLGLVATGLSILWIGFRRRLDSLRATWLLLLTFISLGYVLSPQFLLWLLPLSFPVAGLLPERRRGIFLLLFSLVIASTGIHFYYYWSYVALYPPSVFLVLARNLLLLLLLFFSWKWLVMRRPST